MDSQNSTSMSVMPNSLRRSRQLFAKVWVSLPKRDSAVTPIQSRLVTCLATPAQKGEHLWHSQTGDSRDLPNQASQSLKFARCRVCRLQVHLTHCHSSCPARRRAFVFVFHTSSLLLIHSLDSLHSVSLQGHIDNTLRDPGTVKEISDWKLASLIVRGAQVCKLRMNYRTGLKKA